MKIFQLIIVIISFFLFSCQKNKNNPTSESTNTQNAAPTTTVTTTTTTTATPLYTVTLNYPLDNYLKNNFDFKNNSYWVYTTPTGTDSVSLVNYSHRFDTIKSISNGTLTLKIYEVIEYGLKNQTNLSSTYDYLTWSMKENTITNYMSIKLYVNYNYLFDNCSTKDFNGPFRACKVYKDTVVLVNGKQYTNATLFINERDFYGQSVAYPVPVRNKSMLVPGIGLIYYKSTHAFTRDLELLRYSIIL